MLWYVLRLKVLAIPTTAPLFVIGKFTYLLEIVHDKNKYTMCGLFKRAYIAETIKYFTLLVNLRLYSFNACLGKRNKINLCKKQTGKVLFRVITVVSDDLCCIDA